MAKKFITKTVDGLVSSKVTDLYEEIKKEAAKFHRARITIEDDEKLEISEKQSHWLHCKAGPVRELMRDGWSFRNAKEHCKVEWGREWFVVRLTNENYKETKGVFRYECKAVLCRKLIHPLDIRRSDDESQRPLCPHCGLLTVPIAIKSIMDIPVSNINLWFDEIFEHFPKNADGTVRVKQPDKNWRKKLPTSKVKD